MLLHRIKTALTRLGSRGSKPLEDSNPEKKFNHRVRKDSEQKSDKDKMDEGFNGKTFTMNGIEGDF